MKTRYKITITISGIIAAMMIVMTSGSTCILVDGYTPNWLGSNNGCGPWITYEIQNYFGIFWTIIPNVFAMCGYNEDWPEAPCHDAGESIEQKKQDWDPYYELKGKDWMAVKKLQLIIALRDNTLDDWFDQTNDSANWNVYNYYNLFDDLEKYSDQYSPYKQRELGFMCYIKCRSGLTGIDRYDNKLVCVKPETAELLVQSKGWDESTPRHGCTPLSFDPESYKKSDSRTIQLEPQSSIVFSSELDPYLLKVTNYLGEEIGSSTIIDTPLEFHFNLTNPSEKIILYNVTFSIWNVDYNETIYNDTKQVELEPRKSKILSWSHLLSSEGNYRAVVYDGFLPTSFAKSFIVEDFNHDHKRVAVKILQGAKNSNCVKSSECLDPTTLNITSGTIVDFVNLDSSHRLATGKAEFFRDGSISFKANFDKKFQSPYLSTNDTYSHLFLIPGEYKYFSLYYPQISGTINVKLGPTHIINYSKLLLDADKNIDIAHHIDMIPINSTKHAFSIQSIRLNSDDSITVDFGGVNENFMMIPEFNYTQTFQVNDSFIFYCMPAESGYPSMGVYKYLGTHMMDGKLNYAFYHGDLRSQNEFECAYPEIIDQSVNIFDIQVPQEMLQKYKIKPD